MRRIYRTDGKFQIENLVVPGSSSSANTGTAVLNFGSTPGTNVVTTTITGQTSILSNSYVQAWLMSDSNALRRAFSLKKTPKIVGNPENIVDPKGKLESLVWRLSGKTKRYINAVHNAVIAKQVSVTSLRKCSAFHEFERFVRNEIN